MAFDGKGAVVISSCGKYFQRCICPFRRENVAFVGAVDVILDVSFNGIIGSECNRQIGDFVGICRGSDTVIVVCSVEQGVQIRAGNLCFIRVDV